MAKVKAAKAPAREQTVRVELGARAYDIRVQRGLIEHVGPLLRKTLDPGAVTGRTVAVLTHPKVEHYHGKSIYRSLEEAGYDVLPIVRIAGETYKTLQSARRIYNALYERRADRRTVVMAVGGGVIGDVAGYVAATFQRGLDFVQVPTTLLAQVDSSVGGKVGVNYLDGKNLIGAFYQPRLVIVDPDTLETLPFRERRSGLAEIIKYGAIADAKFFEDTASEIVGLLRLKSDFLETAIAKSCKIKAGVVEKDERDEGLRATLNFGHTVGHALEALTHYRFYRHGEAIAIGMVSACLIGEEVGITKPETTEAVKTVLSRAGFPTKLNERFFVNDILQMLSLDKKSIGGSVRFVLLERLGKATVGHTVPEAALRAALSRQREIA